MKKWMYRHWRTLLTLGLVVLAGATMVATLALFPPALPFIAGVAFWANPLLTMAASSAIVIVSTITALGVAALTLLFHGLSELLCQTDKGTFSYVNAAGENAEVRVEYKKPRYSSYAVFVSTLGFTVIVTLAVGIPLLGFGTLAFAGLYSGAVAGVMLFHGAIFASVKIDKAFEIRARIIEVSTPPPPPPGGVLAAKKEPFSFAKICGKLSALSKKEVSPVEKSSDNLPGLETIPEETPYVSRSTTPSSRKGNGDEAEPNKLARLCAFLSGPCRKKEPPPSSLDEQSPAFEVVG